MNRSSRFLLTAILAIGIAAPIAGAQPAKRKLTLDDLE